MTICPPGLGVHLVPAYDWVLQLGEQAPRPQLGVGPYLGLLEHQLAGANRPQAPYDLGCVVCADPVRRLGSVPVTRMRLARSPSSRAATAT